MSLAPPSFFEASNGHTCQVAFAYDLASRQFSSLNNAFEKVWQRTRKTAVQDPASLVKMVHPEDRQHVEEVYRDLLFGVTIQAIEFRIQLPDRTERWTCVRPVLLEEQQVIVGYADDITARKHHHDTLNKFFDKKNAILNILSHDLAGPLSLINQLSTVVAEDIGGGQETELHHILQLIEKSSRQGMQLIQEFIKQEFLESSQVEVIKRRVNLTEAVGEFMEEYLQNQQKLKKTIRYEAPTEPVFLYLDDAKFMQVLNNLLSNALKFTPDGGQITLALEEKGSSVLFRVQDTGVGIPTKYHATLFEKFTRARRPGIKGEPSVGLGMSVIRTIVEWHHGQIRFESQEHKGTTFFIELPKG